jgi:hypothetical protein
MAKKNNWEKSSAQTNINHFKSKIEKLGGLARTNLFAVNLKLPNQFFDYGSNAQGGSSKDRSDTIKLLCRGALLPGSQVAMVDVPYRGMGYKIPGERIYEPLTLTFMNDAKHTVRNTFLDWHKGMRFVDNNYMFNTDEDNVNFFGSLEIQAYYRDKWNNTAERPQIVTAYKFFNIWPTMIGGIELDGGSNDQVQEFTVQFEYQRYRIVERDDSRSMIEH